ncbi:hypothetical protein ACHAP4_002563 [Fusarium culmorum]
MECERRKLYKVALGFLYSYASLIRHESDFLLAKDRYLLPNCGITWFDWIAFVKQLDTEHIYPDINPRFHHKELRLSRLNYIYYLTQLSPAGFVRRWDRYSTFFHMNLGWLAATTVYMVVVLTAMQVGLATEALAKNSALQSASYGFTVFSILGPLIEAVVSVEKLISLLTLAFALHWLACQLTRKEMENNTNLQNRCRIDVLYDPENDPKDPRQATVDIVAVHSLDGLGSNIDRPWSWPSDKAEESVHWLQDKNMLRSQIPTARIMTFNYDSTWTSDAPQLLLESLGEDLIRSLHDARHDQQRPIVFVAHGFGGLVVQDVVDEASACIPGDEQAHLQVNHDELNKYSGSEDKSYQIVSSEIVKMCKNAATVIKRRKDSDKPPPIYWGSYVRT